MSYRLLFAVVGVIGFSLVACKTNVNQPPSAPEVNGPMSARAGDTITVSAKSTDAEGDDIAYKFAWGDTSTVEWTGFYVSGQPVARTHWYPDTGRYYILVMAKDSRDNESDWSDTLTLYVSLAVPGIPERPFGPETCYVREPDSFATSAVHPEGDSMQIQFDWGGDVGDWGAWCASGDTYAESHRFDTTGAFEVRARSRDRRGLISDWSEPLVVTVIELVVPEREPSSLGISADTDSTVLIAWLPPADTTLDGYRVFFRPVADTGFALIAETTGTSVVHDPALMTGGYLVAAVYDTLEYAARETLSTVPVFNDTMVVAELNAAGYSGYGWKTSNGEASTYDMTSPGSAPKTDFYITDFAPGHSRWPYALASPHLGPSDPGGIVPTGNWKQNGFTDPLPDEHRLPPLSSQNYYYYTDITVVPLVLGCWTEEDHFAMVKVLDVDTTAGCVTVQSWFQLISGLRLISH